MRTNHIHARKRACKAPLTPVRGSVSMHLVGGTREIILGFLDDGIGFDVDKAWGNGLGLVSIRERIDAIGGII